MRKGLVPLSLMIMLVFLQAQGQIDESNEEVQDENVPLEEESIQVEEKQEQTTKQIQYETMPPLLEAQTILGLLVIAVVVGLAQSGGIGGGPIISPLVMVFFGLGQKKAVWDTYVLMFGGSIGTYLKLRKERVKSSGAPLINYKLVLVTLPLMLSGAIIGVATGRYLPKIVIAVFLFAILISVILKTKKSYTKVRNLEIERDNNAVKRESWIEMVQDSSPFAYKQQQIVTPLEVDFKKEIKPEQLKLTSLTTDLIFKSPQLLQVYESEKILFPMKIILHLFLQISIVIFFSLLKGSQVFPSLINVEYCSAYYHLLNFILICIGFISIYIYKKWLLDEEDLKEQLGYDFTRDEKMDKVIDETVKYSFFAGFLGGFVGLGGGTILTPVWLGLGIQSQRAAASATFCVFFTSLISLFQVLIIGAYSLQELVVLGLTACIGSYIIAGFLKSLVQKYQRESIVILVLMYVVAFGLCIVPINTIKDILKNPQRAMLFGQFC